MSPDTLPSPLPRIAPPKPCRGPEPGHPRPGGAGGEPAGVHRARYRIDAMDCPTEAQLIRKRLGRMAGIARLEFNLLERELTVQHSLGDPHPITAALTQLNMAPVLVEAGTRQAAPPILGTRRKRLLILSGLAALAAELIAWRTGREASLPVIALSAASLLSAGMPTLRKGGIALRNGTINIHYLMSLAVIGAVLIGKWPEAAMVTFLFALAEAIEALALARARKAIKALTALAPETAEVRTDTGWQDRPAADVGPGSIIRVRTGARVPLDARVLAGEAALNQAPITGESLPVDKVAGDPLYAGSIVTDGVVQATVTAAAGESTLARIAAAVQEAQSERAPTQRLVDRFARYYTPAVVVLAVLSALFGPALAGGTRGAWLYQAIVLLVIACPCALVISTPVTVVSGLAAAARHGILVKGGAFLEAGRRLRTIALDKTGTLTQGNPVLTHAAALADLPLPRALRIAASLDQPSTHPLARALVAGWRTRQPEDTPLPVEGFAVIHGRGVKGRIAGQPWHLGNHRLVEDLGLCSPALEAALAEWEGAGMTVMVLCAATGPVALFAVSDPVRPESLDAVRALRALQVEPVLLTGDNPATAHAIAHQLGIQDARGNLMPEDKQKAVAELKLALRKGHGSSPAGDRRGAVGMVGDGSNDAPALAGADIGFAMGAAGTAVALEVADVAIMDDDPRKIADFIRLSRGTGALLRQNIGLALAIKAGFLGWTLAGHGTLWMAVFADMGASLLVVFNGLRLLSFFPQAAGENARNPG